MNRTVLGVVIAIGVAVTLALLTIHHTTVNDFKKFTSYEGRFSVDFPGDPTSDQQTQAIPGGTMTMYTYRVGTRDPMEFIAMYADMPAPEFLMPAITEKALDGGRDSISRIPGCRLTGERKIKFGKWDGREWDIEGPPADHEDMRHRMYIIKNREFTLIVGWKKGQAPPAELIDRFFNSFDPADK